MAQQVSSNCPLDEAVENHYEKVYKYVLRMVRDPDEAADISQNVFLKALTYHNFEGRSDIGTWLCAIAKYDAYRYFGRTRKDKSRFDHDFQLDNVSSEVENPEQLLIESESASLRASLAQRIRMEKGKKFKPLFLQAEGFSDREIADILGIPLGTVKSRNFHARQYLAEKYLGQYQQV